MNNNNQKIQEFIKNIKQKDYIFSSLLYLFYQLAIIILTTTALMSVEFRKYLLTSNFFDYTLDIVFFFFVFFFFKFLTKSLFNSIFFDIITFASIVCFKMTFSYYKFFIVGFIIIQICYLLFNIFYLYKITFNNFDEDEEFDIDNKNEKINQDN